VKKIVLKIAIAVFWGLSLPWMIIYALLEMAHIINKSKQADSYSELEENKKLFFIVLIIPFVSIIILFIGGPSRFLVLISLYGILLIATIILILFTEKGFTAFNKDYKKLASDFKEFGIFLFIDFLSFLIIGIYYAIQTDFAFISAFPLELVISIVVCGIAGVGLKKYLTLYPQIKNNQFVYTENQDFLTVSPRTPEDIKRHITKLEKFAVDLAKTSDLRTTLKYYRNLSKKSFLAIKIFQQERNKIEIAKYRQKQKKFLQLALKLEDDIYNTKYNQIHLKIKNLKGKEKKKQREMYFLLLELSNKRLKIVIRNKMEKERQEVLKKIKQVKSKMKSLPN
jgi:hypothetical protein